MRLLRDGGPRLALLSGLLAYGLPAVRATPSPSWLGALGTSAAITALAPSPDGKTLAAAQHGEVKFWNIDAKAVERTFPVDRSAWNVALAFSADGKTVAVGKQIWDVTTGQRRATLEVPRQVADIRSVAFSPDGKILAFSGGTLYHYQVLLFDAASGKLTRTVQSFEDAISFTDSVCFSPGGALMAAGTSVVKFWDARSGKLLRTIGDSLAKGAVNVVRQVAFSPDGKMLATVNEREDANGQHLTYPVRLWDPSTGALLRTLPDGERGSRVAFSPDGHLLAASGAAIRLFDTATGTVSATLPQAGSGGATTVAFLPDGRRLAAGGVDGLVQLWRVE